VREFLQTFLEAALKWFAHTGYERQVVFHPRTFGLDFLHVRAAMDDLLKKDPRYAQIFHEVLNDLYVPLAEVYTDRRVHEILWRMAGEFYPDLIGSKTERPPGAPSSRMDVQMVDIPGGTFVMGLAGREANESPAHRVTLSPYRLSKYEITNAQFRAFQPEHNPPSLNGQAFNGSDQPAVYLSWRDAMAYCEWLSHKMGRHFRLPTEAEWEFAARAGVPTRYPWGNSSDAACGFANVADKSALKIWPDWFSFVDCDDNQAVTAPVGSYRPNAFGLHDMIGNVAEWCSDWYDPDYYARSTKVDPEGPATGAGPVIRGGNWSTGPERLHITARGHAGVNDRHSRIGFRICESTR
jgi:formylglycine-generating enzyme required for sulfatase activity